MLTTNITLAEKYDYLSDKFKKAFAFLRETDLASLPIGRTEIDGDEVYASVQSYTTMTVEECAFESHLEYFDVQYVVEGEECFGYEPVKNLTPSMDYDAERDLIFYNEPDDAGSVILNGRRFCHCSAGRRTCAETYDKEWSMSGEENCCKSEAVKGRSMSCNCMTRTSRQECRGILEERSIKKAVK